jgi:hypothetical protein
MYSEYGVGVLGVGVISEFRIDADTTTTNSTVIKVAPAKRWYSSVCVFTINSKKNLSFEINYRSKEYSEYSLLSTIFKPNSFNCTISDPESSVIPASRICHAFPCLL